MSQSKSKLHVSLEALALVSMLSVFIAAGAWYVISVQRLNQFQISDEALWELDVTPNANIIDSSRKAIGLYLVKEEALQKLIFQTRNASSVNWLEVARLQRQLALLQQDAGQFQKSEVSFSEALNIFGNHSTGAEPLEIAADWQSLAQCSLANGEAAKAITFTDAALKILKGNTNESENVTDLSLTTAAEANLKLGNLDKATNNYDRLIDKNTKTRTPSNDFTTARAYARLGDIARYQKQSASNQARAQYQKAANEFSVAFKNRKLDEQKFQARCLYCLALIDEDNGKYADASQKLEQALIANSEKKQPICHSTKENICI